MRAKEKPEEYAQRRANETGKAYIVSTGGNVMMDCLANRKGIKACGWEIKAIFKPEKRK